MEFNFQDKKVKILNYYINPIKLFNLINLITNWINKKKENIFVYLMYIAVLKVIKIKNLK